MDSKGMAPGSSFFDFLSSGYPELLPGRSQRLPLPESRTDPGAWAAIPHGTTILGLKYQGGALIAGDRRATEGNQIASRTIEKVYRADDYSAVAIAGAAGPAIEMARLFQTELEHYEKLEGSTLSTEGKANKLSQMVKSNLPMAFQGLVVIPLFVSFDPIRGEGRIFRYDITGGRYEETDYHSTGSGGKDARGTIKKLYRPDLTESEAIQVAVEALVDAAEEDTGTGGPDLARGIFPSIKTIGRLGIADVETAVIKGVFEHLLQQRRKGA